MTDLSSSSFALIDAARTGAQLAHIRQLSNASRCLFLGNSENRLAAVAPYLIEFGAERSALDQLLQSAWGEAWGIYVSSDCTFEMLWRHFRRFLIVEKFDGTRLYFRFYDPRVLRVILPSFDRKQLADFFGPVKDFVVEDEAPGSGLRFGVDPGVSGLSITRLAVPARNPQSTR